MRLRTTILLGAVCIATVWTPPSRCDAQVHGRPAGEGSGPVSEHSTNVGAGSRPVYEPGRSVHESSAGRLSGNPVRGSVTRDLVSGPVSDITVGSVGADRPVSGSGTVSDATQGSVEKDITSPLRDIPPASVTDLTALQEQLRAIQPVARETPALSDEAAADQAPGEAQGPDEQAAPEQPPAESADEVQQPEAGDQPADTAPDEAPPAVDDTAPPPDVVQDAAPQADDSEAPLPDTGNEPTDGAPPEPEAAPQP